MLSLTTTPAIVHIFVVLSGPLNAYPVHKQLYITDDEVVCKAQAVAWNKAIEPLKPMYFCLPHAQEAFNRLRADDE